MKLHKKDTVKQIRSRKSEVIPEATGRIPNELLKKDLLGIQLEISHL